MSRSWWAAARMMIVRTAVARGTVAQRVAARRAAVLAVLLVVPVSGTRLSGAAGAPVVRGTVNDVSTGRPVPHLAVTLRVERGGRVLAGAHGITDGQGHFALTAPPAPPGAGYTVLATYRGVSYSSAVSAAVSSVAGGVADRGRGPWRPVQLSVYDTTGSDSGLLVPNALIGVRRMGRGLAVIEEWTFVNARLYTDVGDGLPAAHRAALFPLPAGATDVAIVRGTGPAAVPATVERGAVVVDTVLRPTMRPNRDAYPRVTFTLRLPGGAGHPTLLIPTRYPIVALDVFALGARLVAPGFRRTALPLSGERLPGWEITGVAPSTTLAVGIDGPPAAQPAAGAGAVATAGASAGPAPFPTTGVAIMAGAGFLLVLLLGLFGRARSPALVWASGSSAHRPAQREQAQREQVQRERIQRERARLVAAIADLDLQYAHGRVPSGHYRRARARDKERLLALWRQLEG